MVPNGSFFLSLLVVVRYVWIHSVCVYACPDGVSISSVLAWHQETHSEMWIFVCEVSLPLGHSSETLPLASWH